ncbi:allophanate hydrolase [Saccharopolyspora sp. WRP15-2]|uniref:Allophanate hydrolase n=1 Tax=Saccharopolyspora oryzae TaxID=2997343 RepID=A0ABT4USI2_9PSEU|nr:allophanate hydrolase [Saccharopolyspora oryzae]MDA3624670.1 allophanate hydrolase [Saccharopolyspora oryzae]
MTPRVDEQAIQALEVLEPGLQTTVQDHPGRLGRQALGFFPSGPVDHLAFRLANMLVGNRPGAAALEIPLGRFQASMLCDTAIAVCGPEVEVSLNGAPIPMWESVPVRAGDQLSCGVIRGAGYRIYLAVAGGIEVPAVFGSRSTFLVAGIGGHDGRALERADVLRIGAPGEERLPRRVPVSLRPSYAADWEIEVLRGPHADPDFLTAEDFTEFLEASWRCDLSSDRVAVRFNPHRFRWARASGDIAGGHPSNMLDGSYPLGGILAYGDVLTILGPDSHTSGGFAVIATVASAALWKVGQLRPGRDAVTFREIDLEQAAALDAHVERLLDARTLEVR